MYFINVEQIESRLQFIPELVKACEELEQVDMNNHLNQLAQERVLHLAIETVTDIGSLLIDGFILRDASSYEDIVEILRGEQAFSSDVAVHLIELVKLRKPLVQEYTTWSRDGLHPMTAKLPTVLPDFEASVRSFIHKEMY
ncbi:DUF86 domain-containing protein [Paenibacillus sp. N1-5-1-14]|uniref:DUF86 domain-containing protein n=1 Tax=Paenibacillus radicibacter TaxID=2972488 RepID=UPI002158FACE|nr:HepT-like ribonuclease domain-containing protein [Paenibacillus radicibacter]MCR8643829.1 DUF86 domain-containing protein [Paenibacillus radicibacter]